MKSTREFKAFISWQVPLSIVVIALLSGCSLTSANGEKSYRRVISVSSSFIWQHTFIYCKEGDTVLISAGKGTWQTGKFFCGADGIANSVSDKTYLFPDVPRLAMVGKLGQKIFLVGSNCRYRVSKDEEGELKLSCNSQPGKSNDTGNGFSNNTGSIEAVVTVVRSSSDPESPLKP